MNEPKLQPPAEGYQREGWKDGKPLNEPAPRRDPLIVNWMLLGRAATVFGALGGFLVPAAIIIWRVAV